MRILTMGTYDMLHAGHPKLFKKGMALGELVIGLNTDEFVKKFKGKAPIMSYKERKEMILETGFVDSVIPNSQKDGSAKNSIFCRNTNAGRRTEKEKKIHKG